MDAVSGLCEGCLRTLDEIARWSTMPESSKRAVWTLIGQRVAAFFTRRNAAPAQLEDHPRYGRISTHQHADARAPTLDGMTLTRRALLVGGAATVATGIGGYAVLRAGAYEMMFRDAPAKVVITEYVNVAAAFLDRDETGMVNAVLDALARSVRTAELEVPGFARPAPKPVQTVFLSIQGDGRMLVGEREVTSATLGQ